MEIIEQIGAYAGLASIVGLAVMSALYFSQARDMKRLREWAGRAPERAAEQAGEPAMPGRLVAQPEQRAAPAGQPAARPAPPPVPGAGGAQPASATGARPAAAGTLAGA